MDALIWMGILLAELAGSPGIVHAEGGADQTGKRFAVAPPPPAVTVLFERGSPFVAASFAPQITCEMEPCELAWGSEPATVEMKEPHRFEQRAGSRPIEKQLSVPGRSTLSRLMNYGRDSADRTFLPVPDPEVCYTSRRTSPLPERAAPPASANPFFVVLFRPSMPGDGELDSASLLEHFLHQSRAPGRKDERAGKNYTLLQRDHRQMGKTYARAE